jgi:hypothetical protein
MSTKFTTTLILLFHYSLLWEAQINHHNGSVVNNNIHIGRQINILRMERTRPPVRANDLSANIDGLSIRLTNPTVNVNNPTINMNNPTINLNNPVIDINRPTITLGSPTSNRRDNHTPNITAVGNNNHSDSTNTVRARPTPTPPLRNPLRGENVNFDRFSEIRDRPMERDIDDCGPFNELNCEDGWR